MKREADVLFWDMTIVRIAITAGESTGDILVSSRIQSIAR